MASKHQNTGKTDILLIATEKAGNSEGSTLNRQEFTT